MIKSEIEIKVTHAEYKIVFIPFATFRKVGKLSLLTILGIRVFQSVGEVSNLLGFTWRAHDN